MKTIWSNLQQHLQRVCQVISLLLLITEIILGILWFRNPNGNKYEPALTVIGSLLAFFGMVTISDLFSSKAKDKAIEREYKIVTYFNGNKKIHRVIGKLRIDTLTWETSVNLPLFKEPPDIKLHRENTSEAPHLISITTDGFSVRINKTDLAGEWEWRAQGVLLSESKST
jgi:hypothetical protein